MQSLSGRVAGVCRASFSAARTVATAQPAICNSSISRGIVSLSSCAPATVAAECSQRVSCRTPSAVCDLLGRRTFTSSAANYAPKSVGAGASNLSNTAKSKLAKAKRQEKRKSMQQVIKVRAGPTFHLDEAMRIIRAFGTGSYDQSVDLQVQLGVDPRKTNLAVRGVATLPHGTGKKVVVAVFARGAKAEEARAAGADIVGAEDLVDAISKGKLGFHRTIATPDVMPLVGKVARVLGPRGLMPNPKLGSVTMAVREAVQAAKRGQASFRADKRGIIAVAVGKASFAPDNLRENIRSMLLALYDARPDGFKGQYIKAAYLSSTHGAGIPLDLSVVDPASSSFMAPWDGTPANLNVATGSGAMPVLPKPLALPTVVAAAASAAAPQAATAAAAMQ